MCFVRYLLAGLKDLADLLESRTLLDGRDVDLDADLGGHHGESENYCVLLKGHGVACDGKGRPVWPQMDRPVCTSQRCRRNVVILRVETATVLSAFASGSGPNQAR